MSDVKMKLPKGGSSVSFGGETFEANKKGEVMVPAEAVADLSAHGCTVVGDTAEEAAAKLKALQEAEAKRIAEEEAAKKAAEEAAAAEAEAAAKAKEGAPK